MKIQIDPNPTPEDKQIVLDGLEAYNRLYAVPDDFEALCIFLRHDDGALRGGLLGETFWRWLHISILWIEETERGRGLGSELLRVAEQEAARGGEEPAEEELPVQVA